MEILPESFQDIKFIEKILTSLIATTPKNITSQNKTTTPTAWSSNYFQVILSEL